MKIKPEETIQIQGPYGEINGILSWISIQLEPVLFDGVVPVSKKILPRRCWFWHMDSEVQWMAAAERLF